MKEIVFVGKDNDVTCEMIEMLKEKFQVDVIESKIEALRNRLQRSTPALVLVLFGEDVDEDSKIMNLLNMSFINIPVVTLGTECETLPFNRYYDSAQFAKAIHPMDKGQLLELCCTVTGMEEDVADSSDRKHILVVDDNALTLRNIKKMLQHKYSVAVAISAVQAFTSIGKRKPDLILLDYAMPVTDGKKMFEMLQADVELAKIPVVFLTSMASEKIVVDLIALKPAGYFLKPPKQEQLLETLETIL